MRLRKKRLLLRGLFRDLALWSRQRIFLNCYSEINFVKLHIEQSFPILSFTPQHDSLIYIAGFHHPYDYITFLNCRMAAVDVDLCTRQEGRACRQV
jgi:hypothetical protein